MMMNRVLGNAILATVLLVVSPAGRTAPTMESIAPVAQSFVFGVGADFTVADGSGFGDVTAMLWAVDLLIPSPGGSTSGCEAADFAGFAAGSIALIQRGTCLFAQKVLNAEAAGAVGVLLFNEGNDPTRIDAINVTLAPSVASVPVFFASFGVGNQLANGVLRGPTNYVVHMSFPPVGIPEPSSLALLGLGFAAFAGLRRRRA